MASYAYDALGRRIERVDEKASATMRFYYMDQRVIEDTDGSSTVQRHYIWGNYIDELLLMRDVAGIGGTANEDLVVLRDERFSSTALVKRSDGSIVERYEHDAFGKTNFLNADFTMKGTQQSSYGLRYAYTGRELDILDTGGFTILYFRGRYYDPATGTFYQRDPAGYPDGLNAYAGYFAMRGGTDPFGLDNWFTRQFTLNFGPPGEMPSMPPTISAIGIATVMSYELGVAARAGVESLAQKRENEIANSGHPLRGAIAGRSIRVFGNKAAQLADPIGFVESNVRGMIDLATGPKIRLGPDGSIEDPSGISQIVGGLYNGNLDQAGDGFLKLSDLAFAAAAALAMPGEGGVSVCERSIAPVRTVARELDTIPAGQRLSTMRLTQPGETFLRYESGNPAFSRVTSSGGLSPGTFVAPSSEGLLPQSRLNGQYNLPSPGIPRVNVFEVAPPPNTWIIGPKPVMGGTGYEAIFPYGTGGGSVGPVIPVPR